MLNGELTKNLNGKHSKEFHPYSGPYGAKNLAIKKLK